MEYKNYVNIIKTNETCKILHSEYKYEGFYQLWAVSLSKTGKKILKTSAGISNIDPSYQIIMVVSSREYHRVKVCQVSLPFRV